MVASSIWADTFFTTSASPFSYTINIAGGETIFAGRAVRYPNADEVRININKVCENYLHQDFEGFFSGTTSQGVTTWYAPYAMRDFTLKDASGNTLETYRFLDDWDYDHIWTDSEDEVLSQPIVGIEELPVGSLSFTTTALQDEVVNIASAVTSASSQASCVEYVLYYVNARGGWDSFPIGGTTVKKDDITAYTTDKNFNNRTIEFETVRNISEVNTSYEMNTRYLNDEQSENLAKNLLESNLVYLHNLKDGTIKPVNIQSNQVVYQTYQTNGRKLSQYKITVAESQTKRRRK